MRWRVPFTREFASHIEGLYILSHASFCHEAPHLGLSCRQRHGVDSCSRGDLVHLEDGPPFTRSHALKGLALDIEGCDKHFFCMLYSAIMCGSASATLARSLLPSVQMRVKAMDSCIISRNACSAVQSLSLR